MDKNHILGSFTLPYIVPNSNFFLLWDNNGDVRKNVQDAVFHTMKVNGDHNNNNKRHFQ